jgi:hypothetical protein
MNDIISQFSSLKIAKFRIFLQSQSEAVLPALIGSTLRGAFGHALKAISCCVPHKNCEICFLSTACLYPTVFEPTSAKLKDLPRPFVFEPPIPPITREISANSNLKLRVKAGGKVSFDFILLGEAIGKLPYFIYAFELLARHGLGVERQPFKISEVLAVDANNSATRIYTPDETKISPYPWFDLGLYAKNRLADFTEAKSIEIAPQTPLRIRRNKQLLEKISFVEFFKQSSLRLKLIYENYASGLEYAYADLMKKAESVEIKQDNLWRHNFTRRTNRQNTNLDLDGMLGNISYSGKNLEDFLPYILAGEVLHIGSASSLGLGKFGSAGC